MANQSRHSYVQFYPSDWLAGMAFMPPMAEWLYLQICLFNWDKRAPLPPSEARLRLSRSPSWEDDLTSLIDAGKVIKTAGGGFFVERAMVEAERAFELWEKKSRGGRVSKNKQDQTYGDQSSKTVGNTHAKSVGSNESENENESEIDAKASSARAGANGDLVFSVPPDVWADFKLHRIKLKAPMTERAERLMLKELEKLHAAGHDPTEVLERSMMKGWKGVFAPDNGGRNDHRTRNDGNGLFDAAVDAISERRGKRPH